ILANVAGLSLKNSSAGYWAFAEGLLACEINFYCRLFRFSRLFRFWFALFEFESDIFLVGQHEKCFKRPALAGDKLFKQIRFTCSEQFLHLFALDRSLQNDFARSEVARLVRPDRIFTHVAHSGFENSPAALRTNSERLLSRKIHLLSRAVLLPVRSEIEFCLEIVAQFERSMKAFAFPAAKAAQRPGLFVVDQRLEFVSAQQSAGDRFPDCKIAVLICTGETLESLNDRRTALWAPAKRLSVRHVLVRMKMFGLSYDILCQIADVAHERVARELAVLDFAQPKFPFAGEFRAGQFRYRAFKECDRLNGLRGGLEFLA